MLTELDQNIFANWINRDKDPLPDIQNAFPGVKDLEIDQVLVELQRKWKIKEINKVPFG